MRRVRFGVCKSSFAKSYRSKNIFAELVARLQTLYYLFKVRRARVIKFKPRGFINRQRKKVGVGEEVLSCAPTSLSLARVLASLSRSQMFSKRTKLKIKKRLCTSTKNVVVWCSLLRQNVNFGTFIL